MGYVSIIIIHLDARLSHDHFVNDFLMRHKMALSNDVVKNVKSDASLVISPRLPLTSAPTYAIRISTKNSDSDEGRPQFPITRKPYRA